MAIYIPPPHFTVTDHFYEGHNFLITCLFSFIDLLCWTERNAYNIWVIHDPLDQLNSWANNKHFHLNICLLTWFLKVGKKYSMYVWK